MRTWTPRVVGLALVVLGALPAPDGTFAAAFAAEKAPPVPVQAASPRGPRSGLETRVAQLTRALGLDAQQQATLRDLLREQRREVQRIWSDPSTSSGIRIAATGTVSKRTADRIRAMLNEEQRKMYDPPAQANPGGATGAVHVEEWMSGEKSR